MASLPQRQRVGAYAVVLREHGGRIEVLLSRLAPKVSRTELWTLPGGGVDHGEDPRLAVVREIHEETGLDATVSETAHVYSSHLPRASRDGQLVNAHAIRIVYAGWVPPDAPEPRVLEVDGSTVDAAWKSFDDIVSGAVPTAGLVGEALADHLPFRLQRVAAYAVVLRGADILLTRLSARAAHPGRWTLPGGGIDHGEHPAVALAREVDGGVRPGVRGRRARRRARHPLRGQRSVRSARGLPRRAPALRRDSGRRRADGPGGRRHHRVRRLGPGRRRPRRPGRGARRGDLRTGGALVSESVFTYAAPGLKFGRGASSEIGWDVQQLVGGARRVLLVTDPGVAATGHPERVAEGIRGRGLEVTVFAGARVEPTDASMEAAIAFARDAGPFDAVVAVGGGSAIDTAKAVDLLLTNDGELMDYVNAPVGGGRAPERPLLPLVAVPTTTGTGAESTTICVLDVLALKVKTGISHARLRPTLAVVDPDLTMTQPAMVTASCGMDILCHALESWTARWFADFDAKRPEQRVPYCGANPIADMWSEKALSLLAGAFRTAVRDGSDGEAREQMALAATFAGLGFGNAGVHVPHACAYPIAGRVRDYRPAGYPDDEPIVPHGMAVVMTAPAAFALTFEASPERHLRAAELLGGSVVGRWPGHAAVRCCAA